MSEYHLVPTSFRIEGFQSYLNMPIYAYRCDQCGCERDVLQKMSAPAPACEECGAEAMSRQVTAAAFQLKGTGWYKTDFSGKACPAIQAGATTEGALPPCAASSSCCAKK